MAKQSSGNWLEKFSNGKRESQNDAVPVGVIFHGHLYQLFSN